MGFIWWQIAFFLGMGTQAAISAALFPDGINPNQQLLAALIFAVIAFLWAIVALVTAMARR
jgi:hypothetical protein